MYALTAWVSLPRQGSDGCRRHCQIVVAVWCGLVGTPPAEAECCCLFCSLYCTPGPAPEARQSGVLLLSSLKHVFALAPLGTACFEIPIAELMPPGVASILESAGEGCVRLGLPFDLVSWVVTYHSSGRVSLWHKFMPAVC